MVSVRKRAAWAAVGILSLFCSAGTATRRGRHSSPQKDAEASRSLFAQSAAQKLDREFQGGDVSFLLLDARTGDLLTSRWDQPEKPIPLGSLVKPFTALAYAEQHGYCYPIHICKGTASGCWLAKGHGRVNIVSAVSKSCNSYFRVLAASMTGEQVDPIAQRFGIEEPGRNLTGPALIGLGTAWPISPLRVARAYLELTHMREQPGVHELLEGMEQSAREGTGAGVGRALKHVSALAKTGTAPCTHANPAPGDGFVIALVPANEPELLLMIRVHGVPGAKASVTAGLMLKSIEE